MALSDNEKVRIIWHLGYLATSRAASIQLGFPRANQTLFLVESAMELTSTPMEGIVRDNLEACDQAERDEREARRRFKVSKVADVTFNPDEARQRRDAYWDEAVGLASILGVPINTMDGKWAGRGNNSMNITVSHGV